DRPEVRGAAASESRLGASFVRTATRRILFSSRLLALSSAARHNNSEVDEWQARKRTNLERRPSGKRSRPIAGGGRRPFHRPEVNSNRTRSAVSVSSAARVNRH